MNKEDATDRCKWRKMIKDVRRSGWVWVGECFFWYRPTRVVPDQRPLNGCVCVCVHACLTVSLHSHSPGFLWFTPRSDTIHFIYIYKTYQLCMCHCRRSMRDQYFSLAGHAASTKSWWKTKTWQYHILAVSSTPNVNYSSYNMQQQLMEKT